MFYPKQPEDQELPPELSALERQLSGLTIAPLRIDRDHLMFAAGRASVVESRPQPRRIWFWPAAAAAVMVATVTLAVLMMRTQPGLAPIVEHTVVSTPTPVERVPISMGSRSRLRWDVSPSARLTSGYLYDSTSTPADDVEHISLGQIISTNGATYEALSEPATAQRLLQELLPAPDDRS